MSNLLVNTRDQQFVLFEQLNMEKLFASELFSGFSKDDVLMMQKEAEKMAINVILPTYAAGDKDGCELKDGKVQVPACFRDAYKKFVAGGWSCSMRSGEGHRPTMVSPSRGQSRSIYIRRSAARPCSRPTIMSWPSSRTSSRPCETSTCRYARSRTACCFCTVWSRGARTGPTGSKSGAWRDFPTSCSRAPGRYCDNSRASSGRRRSAPRRPMDARPRRRAPARRSRGEQSNSPCSRSASTPSWRSSPRSIRTQ